MNEQIRRLQEAIHAKFVDYETVEVDELGAARALEDYYRRPENAEDAECCYLGILYFEHGSEDPARKVDLFTRAKYWLERAKRLDPWDAVTDRLADVDAALSQAGVTVDLATPPPPLEPPPSALPTEIDHHGPMVLVPTGTFLFGPRKEPRSLPSFYVDRFPVTNRLFDAFCRAKKYRKPKYFEDARFNQPEQPVVGVSVADAVQYCRWVGKELLSEEQWEKAARGGDGRIYPWGNEPPRDGVACWGKDPEKDGPEAVASHPKNASPFGVREMAGGVWEWTSSTVDDGETFQVVKGGCYSDPPPFLRADVRLEAGPKDKFENIGFRCMRPA